jgi:hypothetical protein
VLEVEVEELEYLGVRKDHSEHVRLLVKRRELAGARLKKNNRW